MTLKSTMPCSCYTFVYKMLSSCDPEGASDALAALALPNPLLDLASAPFGGARARVLAVHLLYLWISCALTSSIYLFRFLCFRWSFVDVPLFFLSSRTRYLTSNRLYCILLAMVEARLVNANNKDL